MSAISCEILLVTRMYGNSLSTAVGLNASREACEYESIVDWEAAVSGGSSVVFFAGSFVHGRREEYELRRRG